MKGKAGNNTAHRAKEKQEDTFKLIESNNPVHNLVNNKESLSFDYSPRGNYPYIVECKNGVITVFKILIFAGTEEEVVETLIKMLNFYKDTFETFYSTAYGKTEKGRESMRLRHKKFTQIESLINLKRFKIFPPNNPREIISLPWRAKDLLI